jgi:hypothetical protein
MCDKNFQIISEEYFSDNLMEDIRLFEHKDRIYHTSTCFNGVTQLNGCSCDVVDDITTFFNSKNVIQKHFDTDRVEKNWVYCKIKDEIKVIYKWFPVTICDINFNDSKLSNFEFKYNVPEIFKDLRGSTCGYTIEDEIWFILHTSQKYKKYQDIYCNYQHLFAIFDLDMNLKKHSELFKFDNKKVEFCTSLVIQNDEMIIGFSTLDTNSYIGVYDIETIMKSIIWFENDIIR